MTSKASGGEYAPVLLNGAQEPFLIEAVAVSTTNEFVDVRAPATLEAGYELTVDVDGDNWIVLVVNIEDQSHMRSVSSS
jgi:hypothetical protein